MIWFVLGLLLCYSVLVGHRRNGITLAETENVRVREVLLGFIPGVDEVGYLTEVGKWPKTSSLLFCHCSFRAQSVRIIPDPIDPRRFTVLLDEHQRIEYRSNPEGTLIGWGEKSGE